MKDDSLNDQSLVKIFNQINKETNHQKIHDHYQKKIKKLYQELIKYKYDRNIQHEKSDSRLKLNENEKALHDLKNLNHRPSGFVNKKIATRALMAQDKLAYYGQALAEEDIDMTWIQLCTLLKVTDKKQVLRTVKGYHDKLPNYLNLKETLVTLINTVDPLGAIVPMSSRNSDECLKYSERLIKHITKIAEHTAHTKPTLLTPSREPLPVRNSLPSKSKSRDFTLSKKSSVHSLPKSVQTLPKKSSQANLKRDSKSDIRLSVSKDSPNKVTSPVSAIDSHRDDISVTSSMIDRIINEVPTEQRDEVSNASFGSNLDNSFLDQFANQSFRDDSLNTSFLNNISRFKTDKQGSSVSDL
eukprot:NODE_559_length_6071_cov_0.798895.p2 type:complete len:356 gc:universal NODE_559_length_6071_cov_0.798895:3369-4436(+)